MKSFDVSAVEWTPVRPDIARGVFGKTLMEGKVKVVLMRVAPGGGASEHVDAYGHLFYFLSGEGAVRVGGEEQRAQTGQVFQIAPGQVHAYENSGPEDLVLISMNLPI